MGDCEFSIFDKYNQISKVVKTNFTKNFDLSKQYV